MRISKARSVKTSEWGLALLIALIVPLVSCCKMKHPIATTLPYAGPGQHAFVASDISADEIWIVARGTPPPPDVSQGSPGSGTLMAVVGDREVPMPLKHTNVKASIKDQVSTVEVIQQFHNPYDSKIEAVYVFPLPHNAAISEFVMVIGDRRIRGIIRERQEAEQVYLEARRQGYVASLLTEERPNIFTQAVANIEPGKEIDVDIKYFQTLEYSDGWYEFVFPMVVGPRFNPPGSHDGIGAVARGNSGASEQRKEIDYLRPKETTAHDISLKVDVAAGVPIEEFECKTHDITSQRPAPDQLSVALQPADSLPNRDFVLRYRVAGDQIKSSFLTHQDERGSYFNLILYPPRDLATLNRQAVEMVFVIDCSGSMSGRPIRQAKAAVERGLRLLRRGDSFQLISFSMKASQLGTRPLEATSENIAHALEYLHSLEGEGGTIMIEGIKAALDFPHDPQRLRYVCFLTDGYIGNEAEILGEIHKRLGDSRIFSFGIGSAVNRYLIEGMGLAGRGAVAYLGPNDEAAQIMEDFFERISHPAMQDVYINWGDLQVGEVFPRMLPDLVVGRRLIVTGRFTGIPAGMLRVTGTAGSLPLRVDIPGEPAEVADKTEALPLVWARSKIADLAMQGCYNTNLDCTGEIRRVALDYGILSPFTAFLAVDSSRKTDGSGGTTVPVAVPVPEGVKYDTTVDEH